jgi:TatD DNase family protein
MIDTHAHLDFPQFDKDREKVIKTSFASGVERIINIGVDLESSGKSIELADKFPEIYASVGVHPHDAKKVDDNYINELEKLASHKKVCAIGEIGLDFYRNLSPQDKQTEVFEKQIDLAQKLNLPIVVHIRGAYEEALTILKRKNSFKIGGVLHCFSGDLKEARIGLDLGFHLSFNGSLTYHNSKSAEIAKKIPLDFILTETDSPYLTPYPHRGERNRPDYVRQVIKKLSEIFSPLIFEDIERITSLNADKLFKLGLKSEPKIVYPIRNSLYLNLTNRCTNCCSFCVRYQKDFVKGHLLKLDKEPDYDEVIKSIGNPEKYDEVVFCGYGEPTLRLDLLKKIAQWLKGKDVKVRLNTNGEGNLIHTRDIVPELVGLVDIVSISLNVDTSEKYDKICKSSFGEGVFYKVLDFIKECKKLLPKTLITVLDLPETDLGKCEKIAEELGVELKIRHYDVVG